MPFADRVPLWTADTRTRTGVYDAHTRARADDGCVYPRLHPAEPLVLRETRTTPRLVSGREAAAAILHARFGLDDSRPDGSSGLLDFQRDAVVRARAILARRGGVLIADSVGLGKTHVALELLRPAFEANARVTIVGPAALERHWRSAARDRGDFEWASYARLGRGSVPLGHRDFVVFDEAHALRNPATRRHRAAHVLSRGASVVLLSATPVNNSLWDLYHLLRLFAGDRAFADVGVPSLRAAFEDARTTCLLGSAVAIQPVLRAVLVRRTRGVLADAGDRVGVGVGIAGLTFPRQEDPVPVYYALAQAGQPGVLEPIGAALLELDFPVHRHAGSAPVELLRRSLLKRLESSVHAFVRSVGSYDGLLHTCARAAENGLLVRPGDHASIDAEQLGFDELLYAPIPGGADVEALRDAIGRERELVGRMLRALEGVADGKLAALERLLRERLRGRRVIVFAQFRDTARYLHDRLVHRFRCALVDGAGALLGNAVADRTAVVRRFAPIANGAGAPATAETIDVLVATDVLSEGFNLQDASAVVSYDLPWNPIRLVQRIGRVDRLGSPHASVCSFHFLPGDLDRYLGLVERLASKTSAIEASIGSDVPALHADIVRALDRRDTSALARLESESDAFALEERVRALGRRLPPADARPGFMYTAIPAVRAGPVAIVAARIGTRVEWVVAGNASEAEGERLCTELLESAATMTAPAAEIPRDALEALLSDARTRFARREAASASLPLLPASGTAGRIGRRLLRLAAALPGGADPALLQRVEAALDRLAAAPDHALGVASTPAGTPSEALLRLLVRLEALPAAMPVAKPAECRVELIAAVIAWPAAR